MLNNKKLLEKLECKASKDGHIIETPIIIFPCGLVYCQNCCEKNRNCFKCNIEHKPTRDENENDFISQLINDNIIELKNNIKLKIENDLTYIESKLKKNFKITKYLLKVLNLS